jgi:vacuolar-type H+-ATPase subunit F/Vma7
MKIKSKVEKVDESLVDAWVKISVQRINIGKDKKQINFRRFTKALANLINNQEIQILLINSKISNDIKDE